MIGKKNKPTTISSDIQKEQKNREELRSNRRVKSRYTAERNKTIKYERSTSIIGEEVHLRNPSKAVLMEY